MQGGYGQGGYGPPAGGGYGAPAGGGYGSPPGASPGFGAPPAAAAPRPSGAGYEFTPDQDSKLAAAGGRIVFAGIMQIVWGVGQLLFAWVWGLGQWFYNLPISLTLIVIGALSIGVGGSFKQITKTQGNDIDHLMSAVGKLSGVALTQIIGFALAMVLGAVVMVLMLVGVAFLAVAG